MKRLIIKNGNLLAPADDRLESGTLIIEDDKITSVVGPNEGPINQEPGDEVIDANERTLLEQAKALIPAARAPGVL